MENLENKNEIIVEENQVLPTEEVEQNVSQINQADDSIERNVRLMSPGRMVMRRFFRSKLSIVGLVMLLSLFLFCFLGPVCYTSWESNEIDYSDRVEYATTEIEDANGNVIFTQVIETIKRPNSFAKPSLEHPLGTDGQGWDNLARLMEGGKVSLAISFITVFIVTILGIIFGGLSGYFGGAIDNIIMRLCDILMCLPGFPILLVVGTLLESMGVASQFRIYYLMGFLSLISWPGVARLVRGQILSLREQEYMVAAEAMGYSTTRKIFKHLIPNVMPQLIVNMTLSLGSMILYEASLSFLGLGATAEFAAWGTMINQANDLNVLQNYFNVWGPPGICIVVAVLGFNFIGDGLRDALDPKARR